jgi:hypothetical protein
MNAKIKNNNLSAKRVLKRVNLKALGPCLKYHAVPVLWRETFFSQNTITDKVFEANEKSCKHCKLLK